MKSSSDLPQGFSHWVLPEMGSSRKGEEPPDMEDLQGLRMPTAEEIEAIQLAAREEGHAEGYKAGHAEGHEAGYQLGRREGLEESRGETKDRLARLDAILKLLNAPLENMDNEVEQSLLRLAIAIAKQIIRRELHQDPQQILGVVREVLSILPVNARHVRLQLNPEDAQLVTKAYADEHMQLEWRIEKDPGLTRGGCRVLTDVSRIDASLEARLASVIAPLLSNERSDKRGEERGEERGWERDDKRDEGQAGHD